MHVWGVRRCRRPGGQRGQVALELLAALPLLLAVALVAWQLVAVLGAALDATERARVGALRSAGSGGVVAVHEVVKVPSFLPGTGGLKVAARSAVRTR